MRINKKAQAKRGHCSHLNTNYCIFLLDVRAPTRSPQKSARTSARSCRQINPALLSSAQWAKDGTVVRLDSPVKLA
jgi:hypothetical protein